MPLSTVIQLLILCLHSVFYSLSFFSVLSSLLKSYFIVPLKFLLYRGVLEIIYRIGKMAQKLWVHTVKSDNLSSILTLPIINT